MPSVVQRVLLSLLVPASLSGWDTIPHRVITKAALASLPAAARIRLGPHEAMLVEVYCMLPDRYVEMTQLNFVRRGAWPTESSQIEQYCLRPDGEVIHGASGQREDDEASLIYLYERIASSLAEHRDEDAARYIGTLSHFVADSLSPSHALSSEALAEIERSAGLKGLHRSLEHSLSPLTAPPQPARPLHPGLIESAEATLDGCYQGMERNRKALPDMVQVVKGGGGRPLDRLLLASGRSAAELLASALHTLFAIAEP